jgi:dynein intermediate chain 2
LTVPLTLLLRPGACVGQVETLIKQNNAIDIYEEYFAGAQADHSSEQPYARTLTVFRDPSAVKRSVSYISWYPDGAPPAAHAPRAHARAARALTRASACAATGARKVAVAYSIMHFQQQPEGMPCSSYIWDVNNPNTPDFELSAASQLCCCNYNPKDPNIVSGGAEPERARACGRLARRLRPDARCLGRA